MIKRILVGVCDPRYSASVSSYAVEMALRFGAEVTVVAVTDTRRLMDVRAIPNGDSTAKELVEQRIEVSESVVRQTTSLVTRRLEAAEVSWQVAWDGQDPYATFINASRYHDLTIVGLRGLFAHGVAEEPPGELIQLIASGVRPMLAAGPHYRETHRVLIGYSGSVESARTMRTFANLNLWPDVQVKVIHFGRLGSKANELLADTRGYLQDYGFNVDTEAIKGSPKQQLLEQAELWRADLLVVGNSAKSLVRQRLFGETALHTILMSRLPMFLSE